MANPVQSNPVADELAALKAKLAAAQAENDRLRDSMRAKLGMKYHSESKCYSVYGLNKRFPVSLRREQWDTLFSAADSIKAFIATTEKTLAS